MRNLLTVTALTFFGSLIITPAASAHCCAAAHTYAAKPVTVINSNVVTASSQAGITVYRPAAILDPVRSANIARKQAAQKARSDAAAKKARLEASKAAANEKRLAAIEANQKTILAKAEPKKTKKRLVYYSNGAAYARNALSGARTAPRRNRFRRAPRHTVTTSVLTSSPAS